MTADDDRKAFLQMCLAKRLLDKAQAKEIWGEAQQTGSSPQQILVQRGLMATHTVAALEKELRRAQEPRTIGGYQLIKTLGHGGMAKVFLARQVSLEREVALKLMAPHIAASPEAAERFLREARSAAAINHPNVISIIDFGQSDGQLYMVLELVTGGDAAQLAARFGGKLPEARALELLIDCAKGLQALYEARLVHRDLKPSNIFITKDGRAKLGDLGLARNEDGADRMTVTGHLVGTPAFMSPEQAGGDGTVDIRSDIYALGATLFALVTGRQPFIGNNPIAVAAKSLTEAAPDPRSLVPQLSAATANVILRAMAKNAGERFQTPRDLRDALEQALAQAPHSEARSSTTTTIKPRDPPTPVTITSYRRATARTKRRTSGERSWLVMAGVIGVSVIAVLAFLWQRPAAHDAAPTSSASTAAASTAAASTTASTTASSSAPSSASKPPSPANATPDPPAPSTATTLPGGAGVPADVEAKPPVGEDPPRVTWASSQGKDAFGHWIVITIQGAQQRLRWLPPGTAVVGSPPDEPGHLQGIEQLSTVTFRSGTWLADTECTQQFWQAVTGKNPSLPQGVRLPVNKISVRDAIAFTHQLRPHLGGARVRLPSRAEWERACRAGTSTRYATGNEVSSLAAYANMYDETARGTVPHHDQQPFPFSDGFPGLAPVGSLRPNRWGFYDMHGNVSEYCLALWGPLPLTCEDPMTDDNPDLQQGFIRGGAFDTLGPLVCRAAALPHIGREKGNPDIGFRFLIESPR